MRSSRPLVAPLLLALLLGCGDSPTGPGGTRLTSGESRTLSGRAGTERLFTITVPEGSGHLRVQLREGEGDADLVVRFGSRPETGLYDCVSEELSTLEECLIDAPQAGTWYVLVVAHEDYEQVRLNASIGSATGAEALQSGVQLTPLSGGAGSFRMFAITVPAGASHLDVELSGGSGDADLFIRQGAFPLLTNYDCASFGGTTAERCGRAFPVAGTWYVRIEGFTPYAGVTLRATVTLTPPVTAGP